MKKKLNPTCLELSANDCAVIFSEDGNYAHIPAIGDDEIVSRPALWVSAIMIAAKDKPELLDELVVKFFGKI